LNFLIDTGSNQNYIQLSIITKPKENEENFFANSIGGKIEITHHIFLSLFSVNDVPIRFFLLPTLKTFHGIQGNDTMKQLNVIIDVKSDILVVNGNIRFQIKQLPAQAINNIKNEPNT